MKNPRLDSVLIRPLLHQDFNCIEFRLLAYTLFSSISRYLAAGADCQWCHSFRVEMVACFSTFPRFRAVLPDPEVTIFWISDITVTGSPPFLSLRGFVLARKRFLISWCWDAAAWSCIVVEWRSKGREPDDQVFVIPSLWPWCGGALERDVSVALVLAFCSLTQLNPFRLFVPS